MGTRCFGIKLDQQEILLFSESPGVECWKKTQDSLSSGLLDEQVGQTGTSQGR